MIPWLTARRVGGLLARKVRRPRWAPPAWPSAERAEERDELRGSKSRRRRRERDKPVDQLIDCDRSGVRQVGRHVLRFVTKIPHEPALDLRHARHLLLVQDLAIHVRI